MSQNVSNESIVPYLSAFRAGYVDNQKLSINVTVSPDPEMTGSKLPADLRFMNNIMTDIKEAAPENLSSVLMHHYNQAGLEQTKDAGPNPRLKALYKAGFMLKSNEAFKNIGIEMTAAIENLNRLRIDPKADWTNFTPYKSVGGPANC